MPPHAPAGPTADPSAASNPIDPADPRLAPDTWGIHRFWVDAHEQVVEVDPTTIDALRTAMGKPPEDLERTAPVVARRGHDLGLGPVDVLCEDGSRRRIDSTVPEDFPFGYHDLVDGAGARLRRLIVSPGRCWLPQDDRAWGLTVQLYAARSRSSAGIGDLGDLSAIRSWAEGLGATFLLVNPLHAVSPTFPQEPSPYLPTTRRFRNPIYLRVDGLDVPPKLADLTALIDRDAVWRTKLAALEQQYAAGEPEEDFAAWRAEQGEALETFATWCALAEQHGSDWRDWPAELRSPDSDGVRTVQGRDADRVRFHAWLQWRLEQQFVAASGDLTVLQDLPVGVDGGGADSWAWQHVLVDKATVGAPPDIFNAQGQSWGSPPLAPWRLRDADYVPFIESIRATMAGGGGIRIDHVMGLFRLWWIPEGWTPDRGAYVRYPAEDLLDILALESHRARSVVVGEDLGTVEPGVREALAEHAMLSYRLLWFEHAEPADWPQLAMGAITTHDLPTIAGLWTGSDLEDQVAHVPTPREALERDRAELLAQLPQVGGDHTRADERDVVVAAHRRLAAAPCRMLSTTLEDVVGQQPRPNMPGTKDRPNWCIPLPVAIDDLPGDKRAESVAAILAKGVEAGGRLS